MLGNLFEAQLILKNYNFLMFGLFFLFIPGHFHISSQYGKIQTNFYTDIIYCFL